MVDKGLQLLLLLFVSVVCADRHHDHDDDDDEDEDSEHHSKRLAVFGIICSVVAMIFAIGATTLCCYYMKTKHRRMVHARAAQVQFAQLQFPPGQTTGKQPLAPPPYQEALPFTPAAPMQKIPLGGPEFDGSANQQFQIPGHLKDLEAQQHIPSNGTPPPAYKY